MEINFKGMTRSGSERANVDGELAILMNGAVKDGTIVGIKSPDELDISVPTGGKLLFVHTTSDSTKNYIFSVGTVIYNGTTSITDIGSTINSVNALGNTLVALCDNGMHYFLWQNSAYTYLGQKPPEIDIKFGLQLGYIKSEEFSLNIPSTSIISSHGEEEYEETWSSQVTDQVTGYANKLIATAHEKGYFIYPFFIRYAYKLYDGNLIMHSAPILMIPNSQTAPVCHARSSGNTDSDTWEATLGAFIGKLNYQAFYDTDSGLSNWKDIIKSIEIFISAPLYNYDESGKMKYNETQDTLPSAIGLKSKSVLVAGIVPQPYQVNVFDMTFITSDYNKYLKLPHYTDDEVNNKIKNCSLFYLLKEINIDALDTSFHEMDLQENTIENITSQEQMSDDDDSHDSIVPKVSYTYNNRLNITSLKKILFNGFDPFFSTCKNDDEYYSYTGSTSFPTNELIMSPPSSPTYVSKSTTDYTYTTYVFIKQNGKTYIVKQAESSTSNTLFKFGIYFYYPNINAYQAIIAKNEYSSSTVNGETVTAVKTTYYKIILTQHSGLNGAYYFGGFSSLNGITDATTVDSEPTVSTDKIVDMLNKIYTSEVSDPFYFPVKGKNTIGSSEILAIVSGTQPISQGQFGQFPLYAFTPDGIWALAVDDNGYYSSKQMASRDVILSKDSICQIDGGVAYLTNQGLMLLVGGQSTNLSHALNGNPLTMDKLALVFGTLPIPDVNFKVYSSAAKVAYDYTNRRIVIFNPNYTYAYMYSIEEKTWSIIESNFSYAINTYPDCYLMNTNNKLVNLSKSNDYYDGSVNVALLTRSLGFNDGEVLKSISRLIVRGNIPISDKMILYGSRDLVNWFIVRSSTTHRLRVLGRPYKYFRLAYSATLENTNYVDGCSVEFEERYNDKIR